MSEVEKDFDCTQCGESYIITWTSHRNPSHCPFCGAYVETPEEDEDNWD